MKSRGAAAEEHVISGSWWDGGRSPLSFSSQVLQGSVPPGCLGHVEEGSPHGLVADAHELEDSSHCEATGGDSIRHHHLTIPEVRGFGVVEGEVEYTTG